MSSFVRLPDGRKNDASSRWRLTVSVLSVDDLVRPRADQPGGGLAQWFVERDPGRVLVEVALHAVRGPRVQLGLDGRSGGPRLRAEGLPGEIDPRRARPDRPGRWKRSRCAGEGIRRVLLEGERLVGSDRRRRRRSCGQHRGPTEERLGGPGEHPLPGLVRELGEGLDGRARHRLAERERVVRPERDPVLADDARRPAAGRPGRGSASRRRSDGRPRGARSPSRSPPGPGGRGTRPRRDRAARETPRRRARTGGAGPGADRARHPA